MKTDDSVSNADWHKILSGLFGSDFQIIPDMSGVKPGIDILAFPPVGDRDFWTLITSGLSRVSMIPPDDSEIPRIEIAIYAEEPDDGLIQLLWWLASRVRDNGEWITPGSTMTNGDPPETLFDDSCLDSFAFVQPLLEPDFTIPALFSRDGFPVMMFWALPISSAERQFLMREDVEKFYSLLESNEHSVVFNAPRGSYV